MNQDLLFKEYGFNLITSQISSFEKFLTLFVDKNSKLNLSAIRDEKWIIEKHFIDSIFLNKFIKLNWRVLDIWTWWWFPCIPLAITNEEVDFTWLDSTQKKINAINEFVSSLWLANIRWVWGRAEELSKNKEYFEQFDFVVSRATAYLPDIIKYSYPFLKKWWTMIFYKLDNSEEINTWKITLKKLWIKKYQIFDYSVAWQQRILFSCQK